MIIMPIYVPMIGGKNLYRQIKKYREAHPYFEYGKTDHQIWQAIARDYLQGTWTICTKKHKYKLPLSANPWIEGKLVNVLESLSSDMFYVLKAEYYKESNWWEAL